MSEIQELCEGDGMLMATAPPALARRIADPLTPPRIIMQKTCLIGVLGAVRNAILDWTLKLEGDGILGEGMTFSVEGKRTAMNNGPTYNIAGNFHGVIGNVTSQHAQIGSFGQIETQLKEAQISSSERKELGDLMDALPHATPAEKKNIVTKGLNWVVRNGPALGAVSETVRAWFENAPTHHP